MAGFRYVGRSPTAELASMGIADRIADEAIAASQSRVTFSLKLPERDRSVKSPHSDRLWNGSTRGTHRLKLAMEIGQKVKICRLRDRLSGQMVEQIKKNPVGTIAEYKMTDGSGVGVIVKFDSGLATWFFEDEIEVVN